MEAGGDLFSRFAEEEQKTLKTDGSDSFMRSDGPRAKQLASTSDASYEAMLAPIIKL
ncbi:hypothetical protein NL676_005162, partial [Syzygium grande]